MQEKRKYAYQTETEVFPQRLAECMRATGTNQTQLASLLGVKHQTVGNYRSGISSPDWKKLAKIAQYFNVSADYLIGLSDVPTPSTDKRAVCDFLGITDKAVDMLLCMKDDNVVRLIGAQEDLESGFEKYVSECMNGFLADGRAHSLFCYLASIKARTEKAAQLISSCEAETDTNNKLMFYKDLKEIEKSIKYSVYELADKVREWADFDSSLLQVSINIRQIIYDLELAEMKRRIATTEGGAHDAENSPES